VRKIFNFCSQDSFLLLSIVCYSTMATTAAASSMPKPANSQRYTDSNAALEGASKTTPTENADEILLVSPSAIPGEEASNSWEIQGKLGYKPVRTALCDFVPGFRVLIQVHRFSLVNMASSRTFQRLSVSKISSLHYLQPSLFPRDFTILIRI